MRRCVTINACLVALGFSRTTWALPTGELLGGERGPRRLAGEPGSGAPLEKQIRATDPSRLQAPLPKQPRDAKEAAGIDEMEALVARYKSAHAAMAHSIGQQLLVEGSRNRRVLEQYYEREIEQRQAKAHKLREAAIARYRKFLDAHPNDGTWTPEIMFRLAELHFESSSEYLAQREQAFQKEVEAYQAALEKNPNATPPTSPQPEYAESIALYRDVVARFPGYVYSDAALYMMGTLSYEMEAFDESRQSYLALTCANLFEAPLADGSNLASAAQFQAGDYARCQPWKEGSKFNSEAWLRIGEVHYDLDELDPALEAYAKAASDPRDRLYDEALIRMAWTLYLKRDFAEAAKKFDEFIRHVDAPREDDEARGAAALRDDAVRYLAKTYAEEDWDGDGRRDAQWGVTRLDRDYRDRGDERHVPEVYAALGDLFAFQTEFDRAIDIWKSTLERWPLTPSAPKIQVRILEAYNALQDEENARRARDALATNYLRGTKWFYANERDLAVIEEALALAEEALVHTAVDHHALAQRLRAEGDPRASEEYAIAARAYAAYLERFPDTPTSYEYRYNYAESLFYSSQYLEAAKAYAEVRDSNIDDRLQEDAASGAVLAFEAHVDQQKSTGQLTVPDMPKQGASGPFEPKQIPEVMLALRQAYDRFVQVRPDSEQSASMKYLAGEVSQRYHHFDDAHARFIAIIEQHCDDNVAINAGTAILDAHVVREDLAGAQEWTEALMKKGCGEGEEAAKFAGDLKTLGNAVRFQEATLLYEAGEFEAAADRYVALVDQAPDDPNADRALNNAAVAYENVGRFGSASQTYKRIYTKYPDSEFADDALLRTGFNHSRFFEFDEALQSYLVLAQDERYKDSEHRDAALWNAADLLDNLQDYKKASSMYHKFAESSSDDQKQAEALFRSAEVLGKTSDHRGTIAAYEAFLARYGNEPQQDERAVEAHLRIGQAYASLGDRRKAEEYYRQTVSQFERRGLRPATDSADLPSEAQFLLSEYALQDVLDTQVKSTGKKMEQEVKQLTDRLQVAATAYDSVFPYRRIDWVLAAMYRRGYAFETWAIRIRAAPVPKQLKEYSEAWFAYKDVVDQFAARAEEKAITLYEETIKRAREYNMANEWTRAARERVNIYKPEEYPLLRQPALELQLEDAR